MIQNKLLERIFVLLIFLFGIWYFCLRILGYSLDYIPGDLGDSRFINYLLEHGYSWLSGKCDSFWSADFMYPFQNSIALSDPMIGTQMFYFPWRMLGFSPETAYQLWWVCVCALNYWLSWWAFNKLFKNPILAAVLAWVFAFSIYNLGQLNYMQMIIRFPIPVAIYAAYRLADKVSLKYLLIYSLTLVYQFYCVPYTGFYLFYFSIAFICIYLFFSKSTLATLKNYFAKEIWYKTTFIIVSSGILIAILMIPYAAMSKIVGLRLYKEVLPNLPQIKSYFLPHESSMPWNFLFENLKGEGEKWWLMYLFPGIILLGTLIFSILYLCYNFFRKKEIPLLLKSLILLSFIICVLHIRIGDNITLYGLIFKLPGLNSMRVLNRFMHFELFILLLILGHFISKFNFKTMIIAFAVLFIDNSFNSNSVVREEKKLLVQRKEELIKEIKKQPNYETKTIALVDTINPSFVSHIDMMLAAQSLQLKTLNGYSSYCPDAYGKYFTDCSISGLNKWILDQKINDKNVLIISRGKK